MSKTPICLSHCSQGKAPSVRTSAICLVVSTNLIDLDPCVKADAVKQPIERNAMSSGNMSLNTRTSQVEHDFTLKISNSNWRLQPRSNWYETSPRLATLCNPSLDHSKCSLHVMTSLQVSVQFRLLAILFGKSHIQIRERTSDRTSNRSSPMCRQVTHNYAALLLHSA